MKVLPVSFFIALLFAPLAAFAGDHALPQFGAALRGYDAVAYQTESKAVAGDTNFAVAHDGLTYLFASKENADSFASTPAKYVPAYGGYCAFGVTMGKKLPTDPQAFKVVDGVLYMNLNAKVQEIWMQDIPGNITNADAKWDEIKDTHPDQL